MTDLLMQFTKKQFRDYIEQECNNLFIGQTPAMSYVIRKLTQKPPLGKGMSLQAIADKAWVDRSYLSKIMEGKRHPKKYTWFRIGLSGGYDTKEMIQFMKIAGYAFDEGNLVDVLLLYCIGQNMTLNRIAEFFITYEDMGINNQIYEEVFGKSEM